MKTVKSQKNKLAPRDLLAQAASDLAHELEMWHDYGDMFNDRDWEVQDASDHSNHLVDLASEGDCDGIAAFLDAHPDLDIDAPGREGRPPLHAACGFGRMEAVRVLLARGASPLTLNTAGDCALSTLAHRANADLAPQIVELLCAHGAPIDRVHPRGNLTPLMLACRALNQPLAMALAKQGADLWAADAEGLMAYHIAEKAWSEPSPWLHAAEFEGQRRGFMAWLASAYEHDEMMSQDIAQEPGPGQAMNTKPRL